MAKAQNIAVGIISVWILALPIYIVANSLYSAYKHDQEVKTLVSAVNELRARNDLVSLEGRYSAIPTSTQSWGPMEAKVTSIVTGVVEWRTDLSGLSIKPRGEGWVILVPPTKRAEVRIDDGTQYYTNDSVMLLNSDVEKALKDHNLLEAKKIISKQAEASDGVARKRAVESIRNIMTMLNKSNLKITVE